MGHGLFQGLKNIEVIISKWIVMWKLYTSIIYPGKILPNAVILQGNNTLTCNVM
jgi:hypothetical protein